MSDDLIVCFDFGRCLDIVIIVGVGAAHHLGFDGGVIFFFDWFVCGTTRHRHTFLVYVLLGRAHNCDHVLGGGGGVVVVAGIIDEESLVQFFPLDGDLVGEAFEAFAGRADALFFKLRNAFLLPCDVRINRSHLFSVLLSFILLTFIFCHFRIHIPTQLFITIIVRCGFFHYHFVYQNGSRKRIAKLRLQHSFINASKLLFQIEHGVFCRRWTCHWWLVAVYFRAGLHFFGNPVLIITESKVRL
jgi:hypothetical protein